jgi:hypothetical protein
MHVLCMQIVAVSNSSSQKQFIDGEAKKRGFKNLTVVTCDINDLDAAALGVGKAGAGAGSKAGASGKKKGEETKADGKEVRLAHPVVLAVLTVLALRSADVGARVRPHHFHRDDGAREELRPPAGERFQVAAPAGYVPAIGRVVMRPASLTSRSALLE